MHSSALAMWFACAVLLLGSHPVGAGQPDSGFLLAAAAASTEPEKKESTPGNNPEPSAEELMRRRYPQPIRVGDLIGLPVLDWEDSTIGFVSQVVRTPEGKVQLIVPYSPWLGWARFAASPSWGKRLVAVPLEKVAILARQLAALEMLRKDFDEAPTWASSQGTAIPPDDRIKIAITRR